MSNTVNHGSASSFRSVARRALKVAALTSLPFMAATAADAAPRTQSGGNGTLNWEATSRIVGQTSTATLAGGGNPLYFASQPQYSGTVALIMQSGTSSFICSGTLMSDRRSVVTAGHCVSSGAGTPTPTTTTAYFYGGSDPDTALPGNPLATAVTVSDYFVNSNYTGEVIDQNDIAVLRLSELAPIFATTYGLYDGNDLTGQEFNVAGYGARSDTGGSIGANLGTGRLRQGDNRYDVALGDSDFDGFFTDRNASGRRFFGTADVQNSFLSDFDNGLAANDASCLLGADFSLGGGKYCNTGLGAREVGIAGGDSGGPGFIGGRLASVNSYSLSFGPAFGDFRVGLNSSWGEFAGYVPTSIHRDFILGAMVPEPSTWAFMIMGFGAVGAAARRKRSVKVGYAA